MSDRETFEEWTQRVWDVSSVTDPEMSAALEAWQARQPEIDALKAENERLLQALAGMDFAAAPTPPAQDEPVAWMHTSRENSSEGQDEPSYFDYTYIHRNKELADKGIGHIPLYTRPDNSGLRRAAEGVIAAIRAEADTETFADALDNLRTALEGK